MIVVPKIEESLKLMCYSSKPHLCFFHADFFIECRKYTSHSIERSAPHPPLDEGVPPNSPNSAVMLNRGARARAAPRPPCPPPPARDELAAEVHQTRRNPGQGHPLKLLSVSSCLSGKVGKNARLHRHPCGERFLGATVKWARNRSGESSSRDPKSSATW